MTIGVQSGPDLGEGPANVDVIVIVITRDQVEAGMVGWAVDQLMTLSESAANVRRFASRLHVRFSGYDEDPRSLRSIPEVVRYFRAVHAQWPYWAHYIAKEREDYSLLVQMLTNAEELLLPGGQVGWTVTSEALKDMAMALLTAMNALYDAHGIGIEANKRMTDQVVDMICNVTEASSEG